MAQMRPDVAFQMVELGPQWTQEDPSSTGGVKLTGTPHVMLYAPDGTLLASDSDKSKDGIDLFNQWMTRQVAARSPRPSS